MSEVVIRNGDCLELLPSIPSESVDLILTDPPYNISQESISIDRSKFRSGKMRRAKAVTLDYGDWDRLGRGEYIEFTRRWFGECSRILKDGGGFISFFSLQDMSLLTWIGKEYGVRFRTFFTWIKSNPMPSIYRHNYLSATEIIFIGSKGNKSWTFNFSTQQEMHNVLTTPNKSIYGETDHPNEKPIRLIEHFLKIHTNEGMTVLDPFMGSGTTGVSCIKMNRNFIGMESNRHFFKVAKSRIEKALKSPKQGELL